MFVTAALFFVPAAAFAHDPGLSSLHVRLEPVRIVATLSLAGADARAAAAVHGGDLNAFALDSIEMRLDGVQLESALERRSTNDEFGASVVLAFDRAGGSRLTIRSAAPRRLAFGHRQLLTVRTAADGLLAERILDAQESVIEIDLGLAPTGADVAGQFLGLGVRHILSGYDHLLFLGALLLGVRRLGGMVKTVSAFTVAHSLTLTLAVLGLVRAPAAVVEPLIAVSIVVVGLENLMRPQMESRWTLTFAFGLVHGFGFAGALQELGIGSPGIGVAAPLGWFNLGVEVGQLGGVVVLWPLISRLNARPGLRMRLAPACSLLVVAAGTCWLVQRTFWQAP